MSGADQHARGVAGEHVGLVPRVVADDDGRAAASAEVRREPGGRAEHDDPVHPVRAGADPPAQPGGAELQPAGEPVAESPRDCRRRRAARCSSARVSGSGSSASQARATSRTSTVSSLCRCSWRCLGPRRSGAQRAIVRVTACQHLPSSEPIRLARRCRPASTSSWSSGSPVMPAARFVTSERPSTSSAGLAGRDRLERRRHADQVAADRPDHADLGRRLVVRPGELDVHALVQRRVHLAAQRAQPRRVEVGEVDERGARRSAIVAVRLMWSLISTGVPGRQPSRSPPHPFVSTATLAPAAAAVRTPWTTGATPRPS